MTNRAPAYLRFVVRPLPYYARDHKVIIAKIVPTVIELIEYSDDSNLCPLINLNLRLAEIVAG